MVNIYVRLINMGLKTIDDVPVGIRNEVGNVLKSQ